MESYTYYAEGNRISCTTGSGTVYYVNDACEDLTQVLAELNADGTLKKEYARGLSVISATGGDAEISYFVIDGQGNICAVIVGADIIDTYHYAVSSSQKPIFIFEDRFFYSSTRIIMWVCWIILNVK